MAVCVKIHLTVKIYQLMHFAAAAERDGSEKLVLMTLTSATAALAKMVALVLGCCQWIQTRMTAIVHLAMQVKTAQRTWMSVKHSPAYLVVFVPTLQQTRASPSVHTVAYVYLVAQVIVAALTSMSASTLT
eukprot:SAG31_NODE_21522_length_547_cov_1.033482_1_plen_131_part_00